MSAPPSVHFYVHFNLSHAHSDASLQNIPLVIFIHAHLYPFDHFTLLPAAHTFSLPFCLLLVSFDKKNTARCKYPYHGYEIGEIHKSKNTAMKQFAVL